MAKKTMSKKTAKKSSTSGGKKSAKKAAGKMAASKNAKSGAGAPSLAPKRITTGSGANPEQLGKRLVELFNAGKIDQVERELWDKSIESIEGFGMGWAGEKAVKAKNEDWYSKNEIVGAAAEGPYVGATGFSVKFRIDVRDRANGNRTLMDEIGVYTVKNGKVIREEFMYGPASPVTEGPKGE
jgi:hypothetical protein